MGQTRDVKSAGVTTTLPEMMLQASQPLTLMAALPSNLSVPNPDAGRAEPVPVTIVARSGIGQVQRANSGTRRRPW